MQASKSRKTTGGWVFLWAEALRYPKIAYLDKNNAIKSGIEIF